MHMLLTAYSNPLSRPMLQRETSFISIEDEVGCRAKVVLHQHFLEKVEIFVDYNTVSANSAMVSKRFPSAEG